MPEDSLAELWRAATGREPGKVTFVGDEHVLPGPYRVGHAAAVCVAAATLAAAELHRDRGGTPTPVTIHIGHATEAFRSERHVRAAGWPPGGLWASLSGDYRAADGWVRLHANYPHHAAAILTALGIPPGGDAAARVRAAVVARPAVAVEDAVLAAGGAAAAMRDRAGWLMDGPGAAVRAEPLVAIERIAAAPPRSLPPPPPADRLALAGVRVLDLTHVIAGPVAARVLAAHRADVLHVTSPHRPVLERLMMDTDLGKRSCHVDLDTDAGRSALRELVAGADVFVESYRPGALARRGFGPAELAALSPGIVVVSLSAYGHTGPWLARCGFDSLVQMSCGIAAEPATTEPHPLPLPVQALDHGTGWLAAFGAITALRRRAVEGGSWHVRLSLARTAEWLHDLGRDPTPPTPPTPADVAGLLDETDSDYGLLTHLRIPGARPGIDGPHRPGLDPAVWW